MRHRRPAGRSSFLLAALVALAMLVLALSASAAQPRAAPVGGYFWWYGAQDALRSTSPLAGALQEAFADEHTALG